jgi:hypothetical protein
MRWTADRSRWQLRWKWISRRVPACACYAQVSVQRTDANLGHQTEAAPDTKLESFSKLKSRTGKPLLGGTAFPKSIEHDHTANPETSDSAEGGELGDVGTEPEAIREQSTERAHDPDYVQPLRNSNTAVHILPQPHLQKDRDQADGGHYYYRDRTVKGRAARVNDNQGYGEEKQAGGNDGPAPGAAGFGFGQ